jgi:hypothetical protein
VVVFDFLSEPEEDVQRYMRDLSAALKSTGGGKRKVIVLSREAVAMPRWQSIVMGGDVPQALWGHEVAGCVREWGERMARRRQRGKGRG